MENLMFSFLPFLYLIDMKYFGNRINSLMTYVQRRKYLFFYDANLVSISILFNLTAIYSKHLSHKNPIFKSFSRSYLFSFSCNTNHNGAFLADTLKVGLSPYSWISTYIEPFRLIFIT